MTDDRRTAIRRQVRLPFRYAAVAADTTAEGLCDALGVSRLLGLRARLADLDDAFARTVGSIAEPRIQDAFRALERKLSALEEVLLAGLPAPETADLEVSADGVGFESAVALDPGNWLAVHLVLPVNYHLVAPVRVARCNPVRGAAGPFRIGAEFQQMEPASARKLTRFAIGREAPAD